MNRVGQYIERAIRAYHNREWDDLLLQLCPCIEVAAAYELGSKGRSSFKEYININLKHAMSFSGAPSTSNLFITVRAKGYFNERAVYELKKAHRPLKLHTINASMSDHTKSMRKERNRKIIELEEEHAENGMYCVSIGHIMYHCLRCEYLHNPGSTGAIEFHEPYSIDTTENKLKLPIRLLYGYILTTLSSPAFAGEKHKFDSYLNWNNLGAVSKLDWLWGNREALIDLAKWDFETGRQKLIVTKNEN